MKNDLKQDLYTTLVDNMEAYINGDGGLLVAWINENTEILNEHPEIIKDLLGYIESFYPNSYTGSVHSIRLLASKNQHGDENRNTLVDPDLFDRVQVLVKGERPADRVRNEVTRLKGIIGSGGDELSAQEYTEENNKLPYMQTFTYKVANPRADFRGFFIRNWMKLIVVFVLVVIALYLIWK